MRISDWSSDVCSSDLRGLTSPRNLAPRTSAILRIDYSAFGDLYWFVDNLAKQDAVHLVNARLTIEHEPWTLTLSGDNLFNKRYNTDYFSSFFSGTPPDVGFSTVRRQLNANLHVHISV